MSLELFKVNEPVLRRHALFLFLRLRVLYPCLDWDEVELVSWETSY